MEEISNALKDANRLLRIADHLTYVTYPLVKDNKLIIAIAESLNGAMIKAMDALLYYDRYYKRIMHFPSDFTYLKEIALLDIILIENIWY